MIRFVMTVAALLASPMMTREAPAAALNSAINIDAHEVASGTMNIDTWTTSWGSYDRTTYGDKAIEVIVRNVSRLKGTVHVTIYFLSNGAEVGRASRNFDLAGQLEVKSRIAAPTTKMQKLHLAALRQHTSSGVAPPASWMIVGRSGSSEGSVIATRAATDQCKTS